jgi:hypothetical protein
MHALALADVAQLLPLDAGIRWQAFATPEPIAVRDGAVYATFVYVHRDERGVITDIKSQEVEVFPAGADATRLEPYLRGFALGLETWFATESYGLWPSAMLRPRVLADASLRTAGDFAAALSNPTWGFWPADEGPLLHVRRPGGARLSVARVPGEVRTVLDRIGGKVFETDDGLGKVRFCRVDEVTERTVHVDVPAPAHDECVLELVSEASAYSPGGLLVYVPQQGCFGAFDGDHGQLHMYPGVDPAIGTNVLADVMTRQWRS